MKKEIDTITRLISSLNAYNGYKKPSTLEEFVQGWKQRQQEIKREEAIIFFDQHYSLVEPDIKNMVSRTTKIKNDSPFEFGKKIQLTPLKKDYAKEAKAKYDKRMAKYELNKKYQKEYWEGVRNGTIRRGIKYKHYITSKSGEPLTFGIIYEDQPGYAESEFILPD